MNMEKEKTTLTLRIPQWVIKYIWKCFLLAIVLTIVSYSIAIHPYYTKTTIIKQEILDRNLLTVEHVNEDCIVSIPLFMSDATFHFGHHRYGDTDVFITTHYDSLKNVSEGKLKIPLYARLYYAFKAMISWKGLRFFVLIWLLSFGILWFYDHYRFSVKIISDDEKEPNPHIEEPIMPESDTSKKGNNRP